MPDPSGLSICSGGAVRCADSAEDAFAYLKASNGGKTPDDVTRVLADGMAEAEAYVTRMIASVPGAVLKPTLHSGKRGGRRTSVMLAGTTCSAAAILSIRCEQS